MDDEHIKAAVAAFMKKMNVTVQREFEKALRNAVKAGKLRASDDLAAAVTLSSKKLGLDVTIHSQFKL